MISFKSILKYFFLSLFFLNTYVFGTEALNVLVVANKQIKKSVELAEKYCEARSIPKENIILLDIKISQNIAREVYEEKFAQVIFDTLKEKKLIDVLIVGENFKSSTVARSNLDFLVLCKGLPFRISESPKAEGVKASLTDNDSAALDSELSLLLKSDYNLKGFYKNPTFGPFSGSKTYKAHLIIPVARLDGANYEDVGKLIDNALLAESKGVRGRAYIDKSKKYPEGDKWLDAAATEIEKLGFDTTIDSNPALLGYTDRFDAPVFYFGWYSYYPYQQLADKRFKFASGAVALHIYSFSAQLLWTEHYWTAGLVARGATSTFGYTDEPFLFATHRADIYMKYIAQGLPAGEAALYSMSALSWKGVFIGDPLFMPFKYTFENQLADIDKGKLDELSEYVVIRKMNLIESEKGVGQALDFGKTYLEKLPENTALLWKFSQLYEKANDTENAKKFAKESLEKSYKQYEKYGLAFEILSYLDAKDGADSNLKYYYAIIDAQWKNDAFLKFVLPKLIKKVKFPEEVQSRYAERSLELNPPPKPKK